MKRQEKAQLVNVYRTRATPRILCCMQMKKAQKDLKEAREMLARFGV